jgi:hypothetical protein
VENNVFICGSEGYNSGTNNCNASNGSYILMLSTHSGTSTNAITISNNTQGAIFYAGSGNALVSQNVSLKEVTAYKLTLENNAQITYESGLINTNFTSGPGAAWALQKGTWQEL